MKHIKKFNEDAEHLVSKEYLEPFFLELSDVYGEDVEITFSGETQADVELTFSNIILNRMNKGYKVDGSEHDYSYDVLIDAYSKAANITTSLKKIAKKIDADGLYQCRMFVNKPSHKIKYSFIVFNKHFD
jgi:hypothetical protein